MCGTRISMHLGDGATKREDIAVFCEQCSNLGSSSLLRANPKYVTWNYINIDPIYNVLAEMHINRESKTFEEMVEMTRRHKPEIIMKIMLEHHTSPKPKTVRVYALSANAWRWREQNHPNYSSVHIV
jgi:hypothetical protein